MDFTLGMALVDYIPVALFLVFSVMLQRDLYNKMSKGAFALFAGGTIMIVIAGTFKATWKLLYAAGVCDFERLNYCFFPMQSVGFLLAGLALVAMLFVGQGEETLCAAAPAAFSGTFIFVSLMILGTLGICASLAVLSAKMKKWIAMVLFILAFFLLLGMGYLSAKDFTQALMNWMAEIVNILGQIVLLSGAYILHRAGLRTYKIEK